MKNSILGKARWLVTMLAGNVKTSLVPLSSNRETTEKQAARDQRESSARVAREWLKYAAMFVMLLTLGSGNAWGADTNWSWTASSGALGTTSPKTVTLNGKSWTVTRSSVVYTGWSSSCIQFGSSSGAETVTLSSSAFPGTIKSVYIECSSYNNAHKVSITVGGTTYLASTATAKWTTVSSKGGTGTSSGEIVITLTKGTRAVYIKSISVTYEEAASCTQNPTVSAGSHSSVTSTTATVSCSSGISSLGSAGCSISSYGFVIGSSSNPAIGGTGVTKHEVGTSYTTTGTSFSKNLTGLSASTTYYVRPYATNGNGTAYGTQTSFTTSAPPKYTVTLKDDNSTLTQASAGASVTLPSRTGCTGYTFAGWTKTWTSAQTSWTTTAPTIIPAGSYTPSANENLYPVYTKTEGGGTATATITASNFTNLGSNNYGSGAERTGTVGTISLGGHYITGNSTNIQCQANNANIYNKTAFPGKITRVVLNQTGTVAFSLYVGTEQLMSSSNTSTGQTPSGTKITDVTSANTMTWDVTGNYTYFDIKKGGSAGYISSIVVTYSSSTTSYISEPNCNTIVNLTAATVANGTVSLNSASLTTTSAAQTVNVTCTPNAGYYVSGISATNPATMPSGSVTTGGSGNSRTVTYPTGSAGSSTITVTFSPIWELRGNFTDAWVTNRPMTTIEGTGANTVASISLNLSRSTAYEFKFYDASTSTYYGDPGAIITDISGWVYTSGGNNTGLYTGPAGSYTFKINLSTKAVQVIYPTVSHPAAGYAYFLQQGGWSACRIYQWDSGGGELTTWNNAITVSNTTTICGNTFYYFALATAFDHVKFRDNGSNQGNELAIDGFSGKYTGHNFSNPSWATFGTYTITYAPGSGGTGTMEAMSGICPTNDRTLTANAFTKTDYSFAGWKANKDVTIDGNTVTAGTIIADGATIQNIISNITLTAQWVHVPVLTISTASIAFGTKGTGYSYTETFTVRGQYLTDDISIAVSGEQAAMFSVDPATLTQSSGNVATTTITVTYSPTTVASHSATITISTPGASQTIALSGTGRKEDRFIDLVQNTTGYSEASPHIEFGTYSTPTLTDKTQATSGTCTQLHYHFVGWITKAKYDAGTSIAAGDIKSPTTANNTTYYAVWAQEGEGGTPYYQKVTSTGDITTDGRYLIVYETGNLAFNGGLTTLDAENDYISVATITNSKITPANAAARTAHAAAEFTIGLYNTNYYLKSASNKYIDQGSYANGLGAYDAITTVHSLSIDGSGNFVVEGTGASGTSYVTLRFNDATNQMRFRFYKSGQKAIQLYKYFPGISWEDYTASCGSTYTITLNKNGGTTNGVATVTANAAQLNSGFTAPVRAGYQVEGYYTSANCTTKVATAAGVLQPSITVSGTDWTDANGKWIKGGDATFYANWETKQCVITLNNQGATTAGTTSVTATYNATTNLTTSITKPEKTGYDFGGYWTGVSGSGVQLVDANGAWIANVSGYTGTGKKWVLDDTALELYAKWTTKTYTVNWYVNGVSVASETLVNYGALYSNLTNEPTVADNALSTCGSTKFIGWVTAAGQYTASGGTKAAQYDPYAVTGSTTIGDDTKDFYAMFAEEGGSVFDLSVTSGDFKIYGIYSDDSRHYATGALSGGAYSSTTTASDGDEFTFTKVSDGVYTIKHKRSNKFVKWSSSTNFKEETTAENWTITSANHGSWKVVPAGATTRAFIMQNSGTTGTFKPYAISNVTNTPSQYYYIEIGNSVFSNYRTGCCSEKITLNVTGATNSTYTLKFNGSAQTSGANVSTCAQSTVEFKITANAGYTLTGMSITGTNKTLTITPNPINTGLPSTAEMTYTVSVPALATGTLTITPTIAQTYSVTYDLAGGETAGSTATARYQSGSTVTLVTPDPTRAGYNFTGWTVTKEGGGTVTVSSGHFTMPAQNVTVTAGWTAKPLSSISITPATAEVYVGQYVELPVTYDPADILTKGYTLVASPSYCVTTGSTNNTLKITGGRGGVTITEDKVETVSIKADADNTKTASVTVTVKPLPVDHFLDLIHGATFADQTATIVNNALSATYTAPSYEDVEEPAIGNACEKGHLHLVGWIESEWADANLTATMAQIKAAKDADNNALFHTAYSSMTASNKTYYAVWGHEVTP